MAAVLSALAGGVVSGLSGIDGESVRTSRFRYSEWRDDAGAITARMLFPWKR